MVICAKVERKKAEKVRRQLAAKGIFDGSYIPKRDGKFVYFALKRGTKTELKTVEKRLEKRKRQGRTLAEELKSKLSRKEADELVGSFDIVGDIAVVEIPARLVKKQKIIANAIMRMHRNVKVVAKKTGGTSGQFRIRPVKPIAGEKRTCTVCRENNCEFEVDLNKAYFTPRLGTERQRIANLVKPAEHVLVPFAGVGPFAIKIGKREKKAKVAGIELNKDAFLFFKRNIERNKCENVFAVLGDVAHVLPGEYLDWANRVAMPLPKDSHTFLVNVLPCLKKKGMLHYYSFADSSKPYQKAEKEVKEAAEKLGRKAKVVFRRLVRPYSKSTVQIVIDAEIL